MIIENSKFSLAYYESGSIPTGTVSNMYLLQAREYVLERMRFYVPFDSGRLDRFSSLPTDSITLYTNNPEILALNNDELIAEIGALGGKWADREDITDNWLNDLRNNWDERLKRAYGTSSPSSDTHF